MSLHETLKITKFFVNVDNLKLKENIISLLFDIPDSQSRCFPPHRDRKLIASSLIFPKRLLLAL